MQLSVGELLKQGNEEHSSINDINTTKDQTMEETSNGFVVNRTYDN